MPVTFLILRNDEYGILKWFAEIEQVTGAPGLDLPALETAEIAEGYGVDVGACAAATSCARRSTRRSAPSGPRLVEVGVAPGHVAVLMATLAPPAVAPAADRLADALAGGNARAAALAARARCSARTACCTARSTSSATPPTPAPTG